MRWGLLLWCITKFPLNLVNFGTVTVFNHLHAVERIRLRETSHSAFKWVSTASVSNRVILRLCILALNTTATFSCILVGLLSMIYPRHHVPSNFNSPRWAESSALRMHVCDLCSQQVRESLPCHTTNQTSQHAPRPIGWNRTRRRSAGIRRARINIRIVIAQYELTINMAAI